jgi:hypothetical protein
MLQVLYTGFVYHGKNGVVADVFTVVEIGDANGNGGREIELFRDIYFNFCHATDISPLAGR